MNSTQAIKQKEPPIKKSKWNGISAKKAPYLFLMPVLTVFAIFMLYPIIKSFLLSFQEYKGGVYTFVGLKNYIYLMKDPVFKSALFNNFIYLIIQVPVMIILSLIVANVLNQKFVRFNGFFRIAIFMPAVTGLVAYALVFKLLLNTDYGLVNHMLTTIGLPSVDWLNTPNAARISLMLAITWRWTGYNMIIMLAGMKQRIPDEIHEACEIDGATGLQKFMTVIVPMMKPIILFCAITSTIGTLQIFDESYILTMGGPDNATITIAHYLYNTGFRYVNFGYAAAISYVLVIIVATLSLIQFKLGGDDNNE